MDNKEEKRKVKYPTHKYPSKNTDICDYPTCNRKKVGRKWCEIHKVEIPKEQKKSWNKTKELVEEIKSSVRSSKGLGDWYYNLDEMDLTSQEIDVLYGKRQRDIKYEKDWEKRRELQKELGILGKMYKRKRMKELEKGGFIKTYGETKKPVMMKYVISHIYNNDIGVEKMKDEILFTPKEYYEILPKGMKKQVDDFAKRLDIDRENVMWYLLGRIKKQEEIETQEKK